MILFGMNFLHLWLLSVLKEVVLFDFIVSQGLNTSSVPLLGLAQLLVILLFGGDGFPLGNVILLVVHSLLLGHGEESWVLVSEEGTWLGLVVHRMPLSHRS